MAQRGQQLFRQILRGKGQRARVDAGVAAEAWGLQHGAVDDERDLPAVSFCRASTVAEPGVTPSRRSMSSGGPNDRRAQPSWADGSFVWNGLPPGMSSR